MRDLQILVTPQALLGIRYGKEIPATSTAIQQTMERLPHGVRRLAVQLRTPLPSTVLWEVLTDYSRLDEFIPNLVSSQVVFHQDHKIQLKQIGSQQLLGFRFSAEVLLELTEYKANGLLTFIMLKGDFRRFEGSWQVRSLPEGSSLVYELTVQGCLGMPIALIEERLRDDLSNNLKAVEKEAIARNSIKIKNCNFQKI